MHVWLLIASDERLCSTRRERNKDGYIYTVRIYARTYTYMHIYIYMYIYIYAYIYIYTHTYVYMLTHAGVYPVCGGSVCCAPSRESTNG